MIDIRKLKELVKLMVENDLSEMDLRDADETVALKRPGVSQPVVSYSAGGAAPQVIHVPAPAVLSTPGGAPAVHAPAPVPAPAQGAVAAPAAAKLPAIESPMVGTFYSGPGPGKPNFVAAGQKVTAETTVCLIEAMKIFNEIKAEQAGTIVEVLVENGKAVEFGQRLFTIQPD